MTDIELGPNPDERVTFKCYDFAGQREYSHTHMLFFNKNALFCVVHNPLHGTATDSNASDDSLDEYLEMIANTAQNADIVLVTTRCKEEGAVVSDAFMAQLKQTHPHINIRHVVPVDSIDGTGYDALEAILVSEALSKSNTRKEIPASYQRIQLEIIDKFAANDKRFSVSKEEMNRLVTEQLHLDVDIDMAMDQFSQSGWGNTYILSNGDICIRPQQLAEIMSDVITANDQKKEAFSHSSLGEGILEHSDEIFKMIWGNIDYAEGYTITAMSSVPPFVQLLYDSCLAYRLHSGEGPMPYSLIPALLPPLPVDFNPRSLFERHCKVDSVSLFDLGSIVVMLSPFVPVPLIPRLQVLLQNQSVIGGNFKQGCITTDRGGSYSIVYSRDKKHIEICTYGKTRTSTGIISIVLGALKELLDDTFHQCAVEDLRYELHGVVYDKDKITSAYTSTKRQTVEHRVGSEVMKLNLQPLLVFLGVDLNQAADDEPVSAPSMESAGPRVGKNAGVMKLQKSKSFKQAASTLLEMLRRLQSMCDSSNETGDATELCMSLFQRIEKDGLLHSIMNELGFPLNMTGIRSLWLPLQHMDTRSVRLMPLSPRDHSFASGTEFIHSKYVEVPASVMADSSDDSEEDSECIRVIKACLRLIKARVPKGYSLIPLRNIGKLDDDLEYDLFDRQNEVFGQSVKSKKVPLIADEFYTEAKNMMPDDRLIEAVASRVVVEMKAEFTPTLTTMNATLGSVDSRLGSIDFTLQQMSDEIKSIIPAMYAVSGGYNFPKRILLTHEKLPSSAPSNEKSFMKNMFDFFNHTSQVLTHELIAATPTCLLPSCLYSVSKTTWRTR